MTQSFNQREQKPTRQRLRSTMPPAEAILWSKLNGRKLLGCKSRRQYSVDSYTVDFYSAELKLAIELDGETHYDPGQKERDRRRDAVLRSYGIQVLRILNHDVYENLDGVWDLIARKAKKRMDELGPEVARGRRSRRARGTTDTGDATPPTPLAKGGRNLLPTRTPSGLLFSVFPPNLHPPPSILHFLFPPLAVPPATPCPASRPRV